MAQQPNLKKICQEGIERINARHTADVTALLEISGDLSRQWSKEVDSAIQQLNQLGNDYVNELRTGRSNWSATYDGEVAAGELDSYASLITEKTDAISKLSVHTISGLRVKYRSLFAEYESLMEELFDGPDDSIHKGSFTSSGLKNMILRQHSPAMEDVDQRLTKLLELEKELTQKLSASTLQFLHKWQEDMSVKATALHDLIEKQQVSTQCGADQRSGTSGSETEEDLNRIEKDLRQMIREAQQTIELSIGQQLRDKTEELNKIIETAGKISAEIPQQLEQTSSQHLLVLAQVFDKQMLDCLARSDASKGSFDTYCQTSVEQFVEFEKRAALQRDLVLQELTAQTDEAAETFRTHLWDIFDRGVRQVDSLMDESEDNLRQLSTSVIDRFKKANRDYMTLLECTSTDLLDSVSDVRKTCVNRIKSFTSDNNT